jgi:conjugative transposon TraN protein
MKIVLALLTGSTMLSLTSPVIAQPGKYSGQALPQLFSFIARSAVVTDPSFADSGGATSSGPGKEKSRAGISEESLKSCCKKVENDKRRIYYLSTRNGRMVMQIKGIYTRDALLFFHLTLCNRSHLDYDMDSIRFFITEKSGFKSVASKVTELKPVYVHGNMKIIRGKSREPSVIALRRFTLPPGKHLLIEAREKNGGRHLQLQTDNYTLVRARLI